MDDEEEQAAYEARLRTYQPAAPRVSSFLSGPPLEPEPGVSRRVPPQDYRAPRLDASGTRSEPAPVPIDVDLQPVHGINPMIMATPDSRTNDLPSVTGDRGNLPSPLVDARGPFDHIMNLTGDANSADIPQSTPWFPGRVRPFDYLTTTGSEDTGPVQQPTYQQSMHSSRGFAPFPAFSSNAPFPNLNIPHLPYSAPHSAEEGSSFPTSASSPFSSYLSAGLEPPPLDHNPQLEPRYPHVYVSFGAGALQKEIDMHTADNPVEAKESATGAVGLIPYHVPTYVHPFYSAVYPIPACL